MLVRVCWQRTTGSFHAILQKHSFADAVLVAERKAVAAGLLTDDELAAVLHAFRPLVAIDALRRKAAHRWVEGFGVVLHGRRDGALLRHEWPGERREAQC